MEFLEKIDWPTVWFWVSSIVTVASAVVLVTPTPKDNAILAKIIAVLKKLGLEKKG